MSKPSLTQPRLPRGFVDLANEDIAAVRRMLEVVGKVYAAYGFEALETPFIEYTDALGKFLPDQDRPNEGVFSFQDDDEQWLSLRYDLTAPLARFVAENFDALPKPYRSHRAGYVFRNEKPGPGRFRQFMQCDADIVGAVGVESDAELCLMMADALDALGLQGQYVIKVNHRGLLDGLLETIGLGGEENAARRLIVMRAIDKLDRLGVEGVKALLGDGRKDESGDFTKGAGLEPHQADRILGVLMAASYVPAHQSLIDNLRRLSGAHPLAEKALSDLSTMQNLFAQAGYADGRIVIDPSVVRGLDYYTGPIFEAELLLKGDPSEPSARFGSIGGGGRYDGLIGRFRPEPVPATGFSIGVSRLLAALRAINSPLVSHVTQEPLVIVTVMDRDRISDYQHLARTLRKAGFRTDFYLGASGFKAQMKYADRRGAVVAIIQGSDEKARGEVQIKDLRLGAQLAASGKDRADYLDLQQRAQFAVPESQMVEAVRKIVQG